MMTTHTAPASKAGELSARLNELLARLVQRLEQTEFYQTLTRPNADPKLVAATLKHVYLSIYQYQPHVTEATFTAVGRMPKHSEQLIREMIMQQVEEIEHADMALRDYLRLGGDRAIAEGRMFPECAAVAAVCHFLGEHTHPGAYLGFMYIFEALTPIMAARAQAVMTTTGYAPTAREFVDLHAKEDIRHTDVIVSVIKDLVVIDPSAAEAVEFGYRTFENVYPLPVWSAAFERAKREVTASGA